MPDVTKLPAPPAGAFWRFDEVKTNHGETTLGDRPILEWYATPEGVAGAREFLGDEGVANALNGTSLLVSYQGINRRITIAGKAPEKNLDDDTINAMCAEAILKFRPGKRGEATPSNKASRSAKSLADAVGDKGAESIAALLDRIKAKVQSGEMSAEEVAQLQI